MTARRGRWAYHSGLQFRASWGPVACLNCRSSMPSGSAWQLEGTGWWLRRRTGARYSMRWCGYCYMPPYSWWMLYRVPPRDWLIRETPYSYAGRQPGHGVCTHQHLLTEAMAAAERAYGEHTLKALASL